MITGSIVTTGITVTPPIGSAFMVGEDGKHYYLLQGGGLGCAETNDIPLSVSYATFNTDVMAANPSIVNTMIAHFPIPINGTPYFGIIGGNFDGIVGLVFYKINSSSALEIVSSSAYHATDFDLGGFGNIGYVGGSVADGTQVYFTLNCATGPAVAVVNYTASEEDTSSGSWNSHCTDLPASMSFPFGNRNYVGSHSLRLRALPETIVEVYQYLGLQEGVDPPELRYTEIDYDANTNNGMVDVISFFGTAFDDVGLLYDGSPGTNDDDFTSPAIFGNRFIFSRVFTDAFSTTRSHEFIVTGDPENGNVVEVNQFEVTDYTITAVAIRLLNSIMFREGDRIIATLMDRGSIYLSEISAPSSEAGGCDTEDEADELQTAIVWAKCDLVPRDIDVQAESPTISPGRALSGHEQLVKPDAGRWRIELIGIKVWTRAELLKWRETQLALDGRNNPILVPFYEAPLSGTPVVAVPDDIYPIGAVRIGIEQTAGADIIPGMHFSAYEWGYIVERVFGTAAGVTSVRIWPPLRQPITTATDLEFNDPVCRCRLASDDGMDIDLELLRFGDPSVAFVEDV